MPDQTHHPECWRDPEHHACAVREVERLRETLDAAATSLETIAREAGRDEFLHSHQQIRGYANNRAGVARRALERVEEGGE